MLPDLRTLLGSAAVLWLSLGLSPHLPAQVRFEGEGRVLAVDEARHAVALDHDPIPGLMPAMRMEFPVREVELLRGLKVGDLVRFSLEVRESELVIATIQRAGDRQEPAATGQK